MNNLKFPMLAVSAGAALISAFVPAVAAVQTPNPGIYNMDVYHVSASPGCDPPANGGAITGAGKLHWHGATATDFTIWEVQPDVNEVHKEVYTVTNGAGTAIVSGTAVGYGTGAVPKVIWSAALGYFDRESFTMVLSQTFFPPSGATCTEVINIGLLRTSVD